MKLAEQRRHHGLAAKTEAAELLQAPCGTRAVDFAMKPPVQARSLDPADARTYHDRGMFQKCRSASRSNSRTQGGSHGANCGRISGPSSRDGMPRLILLAVGLLTSAFARRGQSPRSQFFDASRGAEIPQAIFDRIAREDPFSDHVRAAQPRRDDPVVDADHQAGRVRQGTVPDLPRHLPLRHALRRFGPKRRGLSAPSTGRRVRSSSCSRTASTTSQRSSVNR